MLNIGAIYLQEKLQMDDPLKQSITHFLCGMWGLLALGIFDREEGVLATRKHEFFHT